MPRRRNSRERFVEERFVILEKFVILERFVILTLSGAKRKDLLHPNFTSGAKRRSAHLQTSPFLEKVR